MKKYITLLSFFALLFVGVQQAQAQESRVVEAEMPEAIAKQQLHELHQSTELTGDQQMAAFKVFVDLQQNYKGLNASNDITEAQKAKAFLLEKANEKLKNILNAEQYQMYLKSLKVEKKK